MAEVWFPYVEASEISSHVADAYDDIDLSIRAASARVRAELKTARFAVDHTTGKPVDENVIAAIEDATKAQLAFWVETGDETGAGAQVGGGSILSVSLPGGSGSSSATDKEAARVAPAVAEILRNAPGIEWSVSY